MSFGEAPVERALLGRMAAVLAHRGPDAQAARALGPVGLAHTRLAVIDLAGGAQPMSNEDETLWITFNGEVLNFVELRRELEQAGQRFVGRSDTEVVLRAYAAWGPDCVRRFNGQWAFAVWDARRRELFLCRDRFGIRPLFYAARPDRLVFASEVKAIFCDPEIPRAVDLVGLDQIFTFWCTLAPRTFFAGIEELPPGHWLRVRDGRVERRRYYQLDYERVEDERAGGAPSDADRAEALRAELTDAVRLRLVRADVPVGSYLSGGLDSTLVTALAQQLSPAPVATFSISFDDAEYDESAYQAEVVRALGLATHHHARCRDEDIGRVFPDVVRHTEQPLVRTGPAPLYLLARLVRERGYKVVLTGEGADEMFGGYDLFKEAKIRRLCAGRPGSRLRPLLLRRLYPYLPELQQQPPEYLRAFFHARPEDVQSPFFSHLPRWELTSRAKLFFAAPVKQALAAHDPYAELRAALPAAFAGWDPLCQAQYLEAAQLLPGYLLSSQGDRVAMAHGIEGRFPFLDVRVAELAARLPPTLKLRVLDEKHLLKRAGEGLVPSLVRRRKKQPYRAPAVSPFFDVARGRARFAYVEELLGPAAIAQSGLFDARAVERLVAQARSGALTGARNGMALVGILSTQLVVAQLIHNHGGLAP